MRDYIRPSLPAATEFDAYAQIVYIVRSNMEASNNNNDNLRKPGCSLLLKSCLIITLLAVGLFIAAAIYVMRMPGVRPFATCGRINMPQIVAAIERYQDVNGSRPSSLQVLRHEYLEDASVLRCPLDRTPGNKPSYTYNPKAGDKEVMLECDRHRLRKDAVNMLSISGDGSDVSVRETLRQAGKDARKRKP